MYKSVLPGSVTLPSTHEAGMRITLGNRIPKNYFVTSGTGESDITVHAGSYHLALRDAGIEMCNIMTYSSILPSIAEETERAEGPVHGSVMETIMAVASSEKGIRATAGIIYSWLHDRRDSSRYGGLVCEYNGEKSIQDTTDQLYASLQELYENGFSDQYELRDTRLITRSLVPEKNYGTALVALCFTSYVFPVLGGG